MRYWLLVRDTQRPHVHTWPWSETMRYTDRREAERWANYLNSAGRPTVNVYVAVAP